MTGGLVSLLAAWALAAIPTVPATPLEKPPRPRPQLAGFALVEQVTGARSYLDAGAEDGLEVGQELIIRRGRGEVGRCTVELVSPNHATCTGVRAQVGDAAHLPTRSVPEVKVVTLPPVPTEQELARRADLVSMAPVVLVEAKVKPATTRALEAPRAGFGEFAFSDVSWWSTDLGAYHVDRVDAALHGAPVGPFTADVDLRAEYWSAQSAQAAFLPVAKARLQVWQAQLTWAPDARSYSISAGRVLAWNVPGATSMDGATVSWRRGGLTGGLLGGVVPQPDTTSPTSTRATAGGFWSWDGKLGKDLTVRQEGRLALVRSPELGSRVELQTGGSAFGGTWLDLFGDLRFGFGGTAHSPAGLDGARLEATVRPLARLSISGSFDYSQLLVPQVGVPITWAGRSRHVETNVSWDFGPLRAGLSGGGARDLVSGLEHAWAGPELVVPRLFTPRLSLAAGYQEEVGWIKGRSAWIQVVARPWDRVRFISRFSWSYQDSQVIDANEFGAYFSASADLTRHLGLRISAQGRAAVDLVGGGESLPFGFTALVSIYSMY